MGEAASDMQQAEAGALAPEADVRPEEAGAPGEPTVVGEGIAVKGRLEGDVELEVLGRVEGSIRLGQRLVVQPQGVVKAEVWARRATISGTVVGNVTCLESVELTEKARVVGDLRAPRVVVVQGAALRGRVEMGPPGEAPPAPEPRPAPALAVPSLPRPPSALRSLPEPPPLAAPVPAPPLGAGVARRKVVVKRRK